MIPYGRQDISDFDIEAVVNVLKSNYLTQGPKVPSFEASVAEATGVKFAVAANSATSSLHTACLALGLGEGDYLWTTPITFVASANCGLYCGAKIDFVDIDPNTYNMSVNALEKKLILADAAGKLPKIVVPVHLCGQSPDLRRMKKLSSKYGFSLIEDASHSIGASYAGSPVGNCQFSDVTIFSFHPVKIITTAEGGIATTNDSKLAEKMKLLTSHGVTRDKNLMKNKSHGGWYYEQIELGLNYRMTEIQAALGVSQLTRLKSFVSRRTTLAARYNEILSDLPMQLPYQAPETSSSWHLYVIRIKGRDDDKAKIFQELRDKGIGVNLHYMPVYKQPYFSGMGFDYNYLPESEAYYREAISLPLFPGLSFEDQDYIAKVLRKIL